MKKVLFVIPFLSGGGAERVVSIWANKLVKQNYEVNILVFYRVKNEYSLNENVIIHSIAQTNKNYSEITILKKILNIRQFVKKIKPDIIIPFISHTGILLTIATIGLKVNIIETIRNNPKSNPNSIYLRILRNISVLFSKSCIIQNEDQLSYFPRIIHTKFKIIHNPISDSFMHTSKEYDKFLCRNFIAVGRLESQKNHEILIKAFTNVSQDNLSLKLFIYGEGSLKAKLQELIISLNMENNIFLCGRNSNIKDKLLESDVYILSSNYEGMPNSLMEAMALGLPCISTNCPTGPSKMITHGKSGILIPINNQEELENSLKYFILNPDKAVKMGKQARKKILQDYDTMLSIKLLKDEIDLVITKNK